MSILNSSVRSVLRDVATAAAVAIFGAAIQSVGLPQRLGGPNAGAAIGAVSDPHLLSGWMADAIARHCSSSAACVHGYGLAVWAAVLFVLAMAVRARSVFAIAILAASPLAAQIVVDAFGSSAAIALLFVAVAALDACGTLRLPPAGRCIVAGALGLLGPEFAPVALVYGILSGWTVLAFAAAASAVGVGWRRPAPDMLATPAVLVATGASLFIGGPLLLLGRRYGIFDRLPDGGRIALRAGALAAASLVGGVFATSGDIAQAILCCEAIALIGIAQTLRRYADSSHASAISFALLAGQVMLFAFFHQSATSVVVAERGGDVLSAIAGARGIACVAADEIGSHYVLADGALLRLYPPRVSPRVVGPPDDCSSLSRDATIVSLAGLNVTDWGRVLPLMEAYVDAKAAKTVLLTEGGTVTPHTRAQTPTGRGAFGNQIDSPLGRVGDFTVVSGFTYAPPCVRTVAGDRLTFSAASIPGTPSMRMEIASTGSKRALLDTTFPASPPGSTYVWRRFSIPLSPATCTALQFRVGGSPGLQHWLTFAGAVVR